MPDWSEEDDAVLTEKWRHGLTASKIMEFVPGRSRSAILARARRLSLPERTGRANIRAGRSRQEHRERMELEAIAAQAAKEKERTERVNQLRTLASQMAKEVHQSPPVVIAPAPEAFNGGKEPLGVLLLELTETCCRWPFGDPREPGFGFCGARKVDGSSYCDEHFAVSRGKPPPRHWSIRQVA